jgi:hypothetical protein
VAPGAGAVEEQADAFDAYLEAGRCADIVGAAEVVDASGCADDNIAGFGMSVVEV